MFFTEATLIIRFTQEWSFSHSDGLFKIHTGRVFSKIPIGIVFFTQGWSFPGGGVSQSQREFWWTCILLIFKLVAEHINLTAMTHFILIGRFSFSAHAKWIYKVMMIEIMTKQYNSGRAFDHNPNVCLRLRISDSRHWDCQVGHQVFLRGPWKLYLWEYKSVIFRQIFLR